MTLANANHKMTTGRIGSYRFFYMYSKVMRDKFVKYCIRILKSLLNLDFAASNQFEIIDGTLTGNVKGSVVDAQYKANTLQKLAEEYNIPRKNTLAIGDGANDLAMMKVAGLGVAFHAKPKVQQQAQIVVNFADLTALLCLLSANDRI